MIQENKLFTPVKYPDATSLSRHDAKVARRINRENEPYRWRRIAGNLAAGAMATMSAGVGMAENYITHSIEQGKEAVRDSHAEVHEIYKYDGKDPLLETHSTVVLTGLGTKDPSETAKRLTAHRETGSVYALEYSNESLDTEDMAQRIIEIARANGIKELSFDGYSAGGTISLDIAAYIHIHEPDLRIVSVTLNSSPVGEESLTPHSKRGVKLMNKILSYYPDFEYFEDGRVMVEVINRSDRYLTQVPKEAGFLPNLDLPNQLYVDGTLYSIDFGKLWDEYNDVREKMKDPSVASTSLIKLQASRCFSHEYDRSIRTLSRPGANKENYIPVTIVFTRSRDASDDTVVDVDVSEATIAASFEKHGTSYRLVRAEVGHANPAEKPREYNGMKKSVNPAIKESIAMGKPTDPQDLLDERSGG